MTGHSKLPPSSAARRVACPGSRALEERYKDLNDSPHAREGQAAHWIAAEILKRPNSPIPEMAPNGELITDEMIDGAEMYVDAIHRVCDNRSMLQIEQRIDISNIHPDCWGTPDCWFQDKQKRQIHIWDYKYGHKYVDVYENWQLLEYAAGILYSLGISGLEDQYTDVYFHIIQPRSYHRDGPIRTFSAKASALRGYFNILEKAELEASQPIAPCNPSPQCEHCLGRHACISLQRAALSITDSSLLNTPLELPAPAVSKELQYLKRAAELIDARITGLEAQATSMIKRGEQLPAFRLEVFSGRDRWNVDAKEVITLGDLLGFDLRKPNDVVTPNQAAKLGIPDEIIKKYLAKNKTSLKLTLDENKSVRKIFSNGST